MEKKKKSVFAKIMTAIFSLILIVILAAVGLSIYVGVKYKVNVISVTSHLATINKPTDLEAIAKQMHTEENLTSANTKKGQISTTTVTRFDEKEVGALANSLIADAENNVILAIGETCLADYGVSLVSVDFSEINWTQWHQGTTHVSAVVKIETAKIKEKYLSAFPANMLKGTIPSELYLVIDYNMTQTTEGDTLSEQEIKINNLNASQTEQLFLALDMFAKTGSATDFAAKFGEAIDNVLFAQTNSLFAYLVASDAKSYVLETSEGSDNLVVYNVEPTETRSITYNGTRGATNSNPEEYNITFNTITLAPLSANGYEFLGWFVGDDQVTTINAEDMQNITLTAHWQIIEYSVTMNLRGGEISLLYLTPYTKDEDIATITFTIESSTFSLPSPTKTIMVDSLPVVCNFKGWLADGGSGLENSVTIENGTYQNYSYTAYYEGETKNVSVVVDNHTYKTLEIDVGGKVNQTTFFDAASVGMSGYSVENWYANSGLSTPFDFETKIIEDTSIYGTWNYITDHVYFYPYLSAFDSAQTSHNLHLTSKDMLVGYIDYVMFYEITNQNVSLYFDYAITHSTTQAEILGTYEEYCTDMITFNAYPKQYGYSNNKFYISEVYSTGQASKVVSSEFAENPYAESNQPLVQQDFAYKFADANTRELTDEFNVDKVQKTLNVYTSEQLVWALENGYKPVCRAASSAETVYNKAKTVLRAICDDTMTDTEKLARIYQWIVFNTQYDRLAAKLSDTHDISNNNSSATFFKYYDSWFAEGVFNSKIAVCEGFAKALLIMARIEGIPCVYVTGNGHAWNKVYVGGNWFVIDSTHGNPLNTVNGTETLSYAEFMITDADKATREYETTDYSEFEATTEYCALADWTLTYNLHNFDLYANSQNEFVYIMQYAVYIKNHSTVLTGATTYTFSVCFDSSSDFDSWKNAATSVTAFSYSTEPLACAGHVMYSITISAS